MNRSIYNYVFLSVVLSIFLNACGTAKKPYYSKAHKDWEEQNLMAKVDSELSHSVFLIGDAGDFTKDNQGETIALLKQKLNEKGENSSVVFLGDNVYPIGLPDEKHKRYAEAKSRLDAQLQPLEGYTGNVFFIPGNHDWAKGKTGGEKNVLRMEQYVEQFLQRGNTFIPDSACAGPHEVVLDKHTVLIAIDTQWFLQKKSGSKGENGWCESKTQADFLIALDDALIRNQNKNVIIVGHHPILTNGEHGGRFNWKAHLFPFTIAHKNAYLPLPGLGTIIYPSYRKFVGHEQDLGHPQYKKLKNALLAMFARFDNLIYAAGHEHNLQYFERGNQHYIVSGSGCKTTPAHKGYKAGFVHAQNGFMQVDYYNDGEVQMHVWINDEEHKEGKIVFSKKLQDASEAPFIVNEIVETSQINYADSTVTLNASDIYKARGFKRLILGDQYRDDWTQTLTVPVLDLGTKREGLTPLKKGGGFQTKSLRMLGGDGKEYVLRTIQKDASSVIPSYLRKTFALDLVQDLISASHPYGAFAIPKLADAAGVYHTNPELYFVPDDPRLGQFQIDFANTLVLHETRLTGDQSEQANFANSEKLVSSHKMAAKLLKNHDHQVDQRHAVRSRLFDMLIGDWDRHEDQWRWAKFKIDDDHTVYQPIPRDRDQVFYKFDGPLAWLVSRRFAIRKFKSFYSKKPDIRGLGFNARNFDRNYTNSMSRSDWVEIADSLKVALTDEVIETAIRDLPTYEQSGEEIIQQLKIRREHLSEWASKYYDFIAKKVDIHGSKKREFFEIKRMEDGKTEVNVYKMSKKKGKIKERFFHRIFDKKETKEIRLWGLEGDDLFEITGESKKGSLVRIIGGEGSDEIKDESKVSGLRKRTKVYDTKTPKKGNKNELALGSEAKDKTSDAENINDFVYKGFRYNEGAPLIGFGYNVDDGLFLGGGATMTTHGFRKTPYKSKHTVSGKVALKTGSFDFFYNSDFRDIVGKWGLNLDAKVMYPNFTTYFYGLGNESIRLEEDEEEGIEDEFYQVRLNQMNFAPTLKTDFGGDQANLRLGPVYQYNQVEMRADRFIATPEANLPVEVFEPTHFAGFLINFTADNTDSTAIPSKGVRFMAELGGYQRLDNNESAEKERFAQFKTELSLYLTLSGRFRTTLALRGGGAHNTGDAWQFYQANTLGRDNMRGLRLNRFTGQSAAYQNTDLRIKLVNFSSILFPGELGVLGFNDIGRVWYDGDTSGRKIHHSYGGGVWMSIVGMAVLNASYAISDDDKLFSFGLQYAF